MPETEADRILRQRKLQRAEQERVERVESQHRDLAERQRYAEEIAAEIAVVLRLLATLSYPDMEEVLFGERVRTGLFGSSVKVREHSRAGWKIGSFDYSLDDGDHIRQRIAGIYLLSDGRIVANGDRYDDIVARWPRSLPEWPSDRLNLCLNGLRELRNKLEITDR